MEKPKPYYKYYCEHNRYKHMCKDCRGKHICEHNRYKHMFKDCRGNIYVNIINKDRDIHP